MATKVNHRRRAATNAKALRKAFATTPAITLGDIVTDGEYPYPITGEVTAEHRRVIECDCCDDWHLEKVTVHSVYDGQDYELRVEDVHHYNGRAS